MLKALAEAEARVVPAVRKARVSAERVGAEAAERSGSTG